MTEETKTIDAADLRATFLKLSKEVMNETKAKLMALYPDNFEFVVSGLNYIFEVNSLAIKKAIKQTMDKQEVPKDIILKA